MADLTAPTGQEAATPIPRLMVLGEPCATDDEVTRTLAWMLCAAASPALILRAIREYVTFTTPVVSGAHRGSA